MNLKQSARVISLGGACALVLAGMTTVGVLAQPTPPVPPIPVPPPTLPAVVPVCPGPAPQSAARCHSQRRTDAGAAVSPHGFPGGYWPADLQSAYKISASTGSPGTGPTVAIVDAFDHPTVESDLALYRNQFGLGECSSANGCFRKINQRGQTSGYPAPDSNWAQEIALDVEMVSALCPACKILLVVTDSNYLTDLGAGVNAAAAYNTGGFRPVAISNSYGANEFLGENNYESYYNHPGTAVTVSSGDAGYKVEFPAASQFVTAVGGTTLTMAANGRGWSEVAWSGAGSGCSRYITKPQWQQDGGCNHRSVADVAAVADPSTGVAVAYGGSWTVFGGTSVAAPIIGAVYGLAGNASTVTYGSYPYSHATSLFDVTAGGNGRCNPPRSRYLCTAGTGYDGPTGLGTPNGTGAF